AGYHLIIVKATGCKVSKVTRVIKKAVPGATFQKEIQAELFYLMPDTQSSRFAALFRELEARKEELGILSFGASGTTMEDVFLRVGHSRATHSRSVPQSTLKEETEGTSKSADSSGSYGTSVDSNKEQEEDSNVNRATDNTNNAASAY
ncbi:hypothetical protein BaRGS_00040584, partial [Batillaria attramentaria]